MKFKDFQSKPNPNSRGKRVVEVYNAQHEIELREEIQTLEDKIIEFGNIEQRNEELKKLRNISDSRRTEVEKTNDTLEEKMGHVRHENIALTKDALIVREMRSKLIQAERTTESAIKAAQTKRHPTYLSLGAIEAQYEFGMPGLGEVIPRRNILGSGKPSLLRFKEKK